MMDKQLRELDRRKCHLIEERSAALVAFGRADMFADIVARSIFTILSNLDRQIDEIEHDQASLQQQVLALKLKADRLKSKGFALRRKEENERDGKFLMDHLSLSVRQL